MRIQISTLRAARASAAPAAGNLRRCVQSTGALLALTLALALTGCTVLTYTAPSGEHFSRSSLGTTTAISSLSVESSSNGVRRVELRGYQSEASQALGAITESAIRAAITARP